MATKNKSFPFRNCDRGTILIIILMGFVWAFVYAYITPLDIILNNQMDFMITFFDAAKYMLTGALFLLAVYLVVALVSLIISKKLFIVLNILLLDIIISFYVQELFLNGKMVRSEDGSAVGKITNMELSLNLFVHFSIVIFPVVILIYYLFKLRGNTEKIRKIETLVIKKIFLPATLIIIVMKISGFASSYISNDPTRYQPADDNSVKLASYEPTVSFSEKNNIYVFIVDRFDSFWCDNLFEAYPELEDMLDGFTFYRNNLSHYTNTFPSIASMLTANLYDDSEWFNYLNRAWEGENALSILKDNGYKINMILDRATTYGKQSNIIELADNFEKPKDMDYYVDEKKIRNIFYGLTLSRVLPYSFKGFYDYVLSDISNVRYINYTFDARFKYYVGAVCCDSDCAIYDYVSSASFNTESDSNVFTIIHLHGAHDFNKDLIDKTGIERPMNAVGITTTVRANFETILRYIDMAKENDVYDKTTFIILGDHGKSPGQITGDNKLLTEPDVTALLVKPAGAVSGKLKYDNTSTLSNDMLAASILEYAGIDHKDYGYSYDDVVKTGKIIPREFKTYVWCGIGKVMPNTTYIIDGDARNLDNWKIIERSK